MIATQAPLVHMPEPEAEPVTYTRCPLAEQVPEMGQLTRLKFVIFVPFVGRLTATVGAIVPMLNQRESSLALPKPSSKLAMIPTLP